MRVQTELLFAGRVTPARGRALPGQPQLRDEDAGEAELSVTGDDQPGPPVRGGRVAEPGRGPLQDVLEQPERLLDAKATAP